MEFVVWITERLQMASFLAGNENRGGGERVACLTIMETAEAVQYLESPGGVG
jgi:hypothetical protein